MTCRNEHTKTRIYQETTENIKYPAKPVNQCYACCNKNYTKHYCHQYASQQYTAIIFLLNRKGRKNNNENKNIINAETPFHQVTTEVLQSYYLAVLCPQKNKKGKSKPYPKKGLKQRLADTDLFTSLAQKTQIKYQCQ